MRRSTWWWVLVLAVCLTVGLGAPVWHAHRASARFPVTAADLSAGRAALAALSVRGSADRERSPPPYARDEFGQAWADEDGNGCDTRDDVLRRDLRDATLDPEGCVVLSGTLVDPYTGATIAFARGPDSADVQIDHVVALADAWASGASGWDRARRQAFANDPANLLAVDGPANQDKGAADASRWVPPAVGYRCVYVLRQVRVKAAYGLTVTTDEAAALRAGLDACVVAG